MSPHKKQKSDDVPDDARDETMRIEREALQVLQDEIGAALASANEAVRAAIESTAKASLVDEAINAVAKTDYALAAALGQIGAGEASEDQATALQERAVEAAQEEALRAVAAAVAGVPPPSPRR